jgi:hypothetical protein
MVCRRKRIKILLVSLVGLVDQETLKKVTHTLLNFVLCLPVVFLGCESYIHHFLSLGELAYDIIAMRIVDTKQMHFLCSASDGSQQIVSTDIQTAGGRRGFPFPLPFLLTAI